VSIEINKSRENIMLIEELIGNASEAIQLAAVSKNGIEIARISNPSKAVQLAAIAQNANAFKYIQNPDEEIKLAAVIKDGSLIHQMMNPSRKIIKVVISKNGMAIQYISNIPADIINDCKHSILKSILESFKNVSDGQFYIPLVMIRMLRERYKVHWPELDIIEKSINYEKR
jgi:hypothetical protein